MLPNYRTAAHAQQPKQKGSRFSLAVKGPNLARREAQTNEYK
jgi:hypothetical protein